MTILRSETTSAAREIMARFCERTGLTGGVPPRRYLWTDAFAVCNLLELHRRTGEDHWRDLAQRLVEQVHHVLGRHRGDDGRAGWISGLGEEEGRAHPTRGGLRIGKPYPERAPDEPLDERLEWDRDGQYFHYSTKWMHALARLASATGERRYLAWAVELARVSRAAFTWAPPGGRRRMHWKMSIDLSRPLVPAMGHHDPLDGWLTFRELVAPREPNAEPADEAPDLGAEIAAMKGLCAGTDWTTVDPLGLGGLLGDAYRLAQLRARDDDEDGSPLLAGLLHGAASGLIAWSGSAPLRGPASERLAFRELGLSIGLQAVPELRALCADEVGPFGAAIASLLGRLEQFLPSVRRIETFWRDLEHQAAPTWTAHLDINAVMLATSLAPTSYLSI